MDYLAVQLQIPSCIEQADGEPADAKSALAFAISKSKKLYRNAISYIINISG